MTNKLMFACRTCQFSEEALSSCVFRNNMYNTVGETAGVTQDVGSDPTVCAPASFDSDFDSGFESDRVCLCCTFCGMEVVGEDEEEEEEEEEGEEGEQGKGADVMVFDLSEMDEEMDGEPDTTSDEQQAMTSPSYIGEKMGCERAM